MTHLYARHETYTGMDCAICGKSAEQHSDDYYYFGGSKFTWLIWREALTGAGEKKS